MASSPSPRGRSGSSRSGRSAPAPQKSPMPMMIGGGVVVVVLLVLMLNRGDSTGANAGQTNNAPAPTPAAAPATKVAGDKVQLKSAKAGKSPATAAPSLTAATLQELSDLLAQIKTLRNESVTARTTQSDNQMARTKMTEAKRLCEQWLAKIQPQLQWQEQAQMDDWAQPAEYVTLEQLYATYQRLDNEIRKGGGG